MNAFEIMDNTYRANYRNKAGGKLTLGSLVRGIKLARKAVLETAPVTTASEVRDACAAVLGPSSFCCEAVEMVSGRLSVLASKYPGGQPVERCPQERTPEWLGFERRIAEAHGPDFKWAFGECYWIRPKASPSRRPRRGS